MPMRASDSWNVAGYIERLRLDDALTRLGVPIDATSRGTLRGDRPAQRSRGGAHDDGGRVVTGRGWRRHRRRCPPASRPWPTPPVPVSSSIDSTRAPGQARSTGSAAGPRGPGPSTRALNAAEFHLTAIPGVPPVPDLESVLSGELRGIGDAGRADRPRLSRRRPQTVWREAALPDFRVDLTADGREVTLEGKVAQAVLLTGRMPLVAPWPLRLDVDLAALPMVELLRVFPALAARDASATVSGRGLVDIELGSPSRLRYEARVDGRRGQPHAAGVEDRVLFARRRSGGRHGSRPRRAVRCRASARRR